ncbi:hypothetical protein D0T60_11710 [Bacteroides sp. 224]|nr:hypothetical protein [Bacteroides sp. 224]
MREYCLNNFDTNKDGMISKEEAAQAKEFYLLFWEQKASTIEGLQYFYNLESITINNNLILNFDARPFKNLKTLSLYSNSLNKIYLADSQVLEELSLSSRRKLVLDFHKNVALQKLSLNLPRVDQIDVSNHPHLKKLSLSKMSLQAFNVGALTELESLELTEMNLPEPLDLSKNVHLKELTIKECKLTQIDLSHNSELKKLDLQNNQLTTIDLTTNVNLENIYLNTNSLTKLNISNNKKLNKLTCGENELTSLIVSKNPLLTYLDCEHNNLTKLNLSKNRQLMTLDVRSNPIRLSDIKLGTVPGKELGIDIDIPDEQRITSEQAIERLESDLQKVNDADFHLLVPYTNGKEWGLLDSRTGKSVMKPWLNNIYFFTPNNKAYTYQGQLINLYVKNGKLSFKKEEQEFSGVEFMAYKEEKSTIKVIPLNSGFKGFTVDEKGELASYSALYHAQGVHGFNIIPFKYKGKYYAWATLKDANYQKVIIDENGDYAPAFNGIYKNIERCFHVPAEEGKWFFVEDLEGNSYFQNMEGERKMENVFDINPYRKGNSTFGYVIVPSKGQDGVFDLMKLEWKIKPQSSFVFNRLNYASKEDLSRYSHLPKDRDKALIYILVKNKKHKMFFMDLEGKKYVVQ